MASLLKVRAERAIGFPQPQEIGELRLNFIRVSADAPGLRYGLVKLAPLVAGITALWAIASHVFDWREAASFALPGNIDDLARALSRLTLTADFWLWVYLAFAVANTMFPALRRPPGMRRKTAFAAAAGALILFAWQLAGAVDVSVARGIESLVGNLALVVLQIVVINLFVVLVLGSLEALIERVSGKSASFAEGRMIALSRQEAQERKARDGRARREARSQNEAKAAVKAVASIYELKLPIPGPPGREPVSRSAVSVINLKADQMDAAPDKPKPTSRPRPSTGEAGRPKPASKVSAVEGSAKPVHAEKPKTPAARRQSPGGLRSCGDAPAPFSRPFVGADASRIPDEDETVRAEADNDGERFPRPFAMKTRAGSDAVVGDSQPMSSRADAPAPGRAGTSSAQEKAQAP